MFKAYKNNKLSQISSYMMSHIINLIQEEYQQFAQHQIIKPRHRNQFTKDRKFIKKFEKKKKSGYKTTIVIASIPQALKNSNIFRLNSNIQFPRNAKYFPQLGCLNVDFYSYNYKINRIDRNGSLTTITYAPIDNPQPPVEAVQTVMLQGDERLLHSFNFLNVKKLDKEQFNILTQQQLIDFEQRIATPYLGIISKVQKDRIITLHRTVNDQYLACLGIDHEILQHYGYETGALPNPIFVEESGYISFNLHFFFRVSALNFYESQKLMTNYRGEKFPAKVSFHNYHVQIGEDFYEYQFLIWDVDQRWCSKQRVIENKMDYFNLKEAPATTLRNIPDYNFCDQKYKCGYKQIG